MYQIWLVRTMKGKEIVDGHKSKYGSLENLKKILKEDTKNPVLIHNLEEWEVYKDRLDADVKERRILFTDDYPIGKIELKLLNSIKTDNPESIRELARLVGKDIKTVQPKVNMLAKEGFIELKDGTKNNKIPVFPYESMEIVIGEPPIPE